MFKSNDLKERESKGEVMNSNNIIGKGSTFNGNIETFGNIRVEGRIIGDVRCKSKVAIGQSAFIEGNVIAKEAEIEGEISGSVEASDILILKPTCNVKGDIIANKLVVESGAKFHGKCKMGSVKEVELRKTLGQEKSTKQAS